MFYSITLAAVMSAGALTQFCVYAPTPWALVTPLLLGIALQLLVQGSHSTLVSTVFLGVMWITLVMVAQRFSVVMRRDLEQRYRNADLVAELSAQKNVAEAASPPMPWPSTGKQCPFRSSDQGLCLGLAVARRMADMMGLGWLT